MTVRFATLCDTCGARSEEYTTWPSCLECQQDCCPDCYKPGSKTDADVDAPERCLCLTCDCPECGGDGHIDVSSDGGDTIYWETCRVCYGWESGDEPERERDADDGSSYGHPADELRDRLERDL
jgi:hypothetical protein